MKNSLPAMFLMSLMLWVSPTTAGTLPRVNEADWTDLISFRPPLDVQASLLARSPKQRYWRPHRLEGGTGPTNLDFYPVRVSKLPMRDGRQMSPAQLQEFIRQSFPSLIDERRASFVPLIASVDGVRWDSEMPLGAIMSFRLKLRGEFFEGASVVVSQASAFSWRFSTAYTAQDSGHPVSGNREFGYYEDGKSYVFYTSAADRPTQIYDYAIGQVTSSFFKAFLKRVGLRDVSEWIPVLFDEGDQIWREYQLRVVSLIVRAGGAATVEKPTTRRVEWLQILARNEWNPATGWLVNFGIAPLSIDSKFVEPIFLSGGDIGLRAATGDSYLFHDSNADAIVDKSEVTRLGGEGRPTNLVGADLEGIAYGYSGDKDADTASAALWSRDGQIFSVPSAGFAASRILGGDGRGNYVGAVSVRSQGQVRRIASRWKRMVGDSPQSVAGFATLPPKGVGYTSEAVAVNKSGHIIGTVEYQDGRISGHLWRNDVGTDIGNLGAQMVIPTAISDTGIIIGHSGTASKQLHAFIWENGVMKDLGTLGGNLSFAMSINASGVVVGSARAAGRVMRAVVWRRGSIRDLNLDLPSGSDWVLDNATSIDQDGRIVGVGKLKGTRSAFVLYPLQ